MDPQRLDVNIPIIASSCLTPGMDLGGQHSSWQYRGSGPAQGRDLALIHRGDSEKARQKAEEMYRKVLYLTGQYEDRVRDMEELLEAIQSQLEEAEREAQAVEQQNSQLHSFNAGLRSLMVQLQTYAALHSRRSPEGMRSLCRAPPIVRTPRLQNKLSTHRLILDRSPL